MSQESRWNPISLAGAWRNQLLGGSPWLLCFIADLHPTRKLSEEQMAINSGQLWRDWQIFKNLHAHLQDSWIWLVCGLLSCYHCYDLKLFCKASGNLYKATLLGLVSYYWYVTKACIFRNLPMDLLETVEENLRKKIKLWGRESRRKSQNSRYSDALYSHPFEKCS